MNNIKKCTRCVMDTTAANIKFDSQGNCNYCNELIKRLNDPEEIVNRTDELDILIDKIKNSGKGKDYDCIVGLSGGVDSTYTLHLVKELGLRPLAVHMDNGWNSELATNNIKNIVDKLDVHLYTHVVDWEEYKALMQSFFDSDVIDIELLYDNAQRAVNYNLAKKFNIKYILSGLNTATEGMRIPVNWSWYKFDQFNIKRLAKKGNVKIKSLPTMSTLKYIFCKFFLKIERVPFLDYFEYNKEEAMDFLSQEYSYKKYPYKHYESIFTRFYQGYILPNKFDVDKRKLHFSTLICTNQMKREAALKSLEEIPYHSKKELEEDIDYFLKKMEWTRQDLDEYLTRPEISHLVYGSEKFIMQFMSKVYRIFR